MLASVAVAGSALFIAFPLIAGRAPTSLLPPGFSSEPEGEVPANEPSQPPATPGSSQPPAGQSPLQLDLSRLGEPDGEVLNNLQAAQLTPEDLAQQQEKYDLPPGMRRSLAKIGPLTPEHGGLSEEAFGSESGQYLATLMRETRAPLVSRWASIMLRRALLSGTRTPADINGADWAAERAWLLVRMGEADAARIMVQSVDSNQYSPRLYAVAMQAYLASADPVGLCPLYQGARVDSDSPSWRMAEAICASFSAEQGRASAVLNQEQRRGVVRGIDYRLAEKIVGAGTNARRSVKIEWEGVDQLTAWRFGLATAANVEIPEALIKGAGDHVRAWQARAPMLAIPSRLASVEIAARLGVFSSAALVDYYSELESDDDRPAGFVDRAADLRLAYSAPTPAGRIDAMRELWSRTQGYELATLLALSRAAAVLPYIEVNGADSSHLIAAMLSAGYDRSAVRWARAAGDVLEREDAADGWAMLAVGAPQAVDRLDMGRLREYVATGPRGQMLLAGLAGLNRIGGEQLSRVAADVGLSFQPRTRWERAIDAAGRRREKGTVAVLAAVGMQVSRWDRMPPVHLYHIVAALHRAGLNAEARMIAAEAVMRS